MMVLVDPIHKDKVTAALRGQHAGGTAYACHFTPGGVQVLRVP